MDDCMMHYCAPCMRRGVTHPTQYTMGKVSYGFLKKSCEFTEFPGISRISRNFRNLWNFQNFPRISGGKIQGFFVVSGCNRL